MKIKDLQNEIKGLSQAELVAKEKSYSHIGLLS